MEHRDVSTSESASRHPDDLIRALEALPDQQAAELARELLQSVLSLHRRALARMLELVAAEPAEPAAVRLTAALVQDERISAVLLLHGLHPIDLNTRVLGALDRLHPHLATQGVGVEGVEFDGGHVWVKLRAADAGGNRDSSAEAIRQQIERALLEDAPDLAGVDIDGLPVHTVAVPLSRIAVRNRASGVTAAAEP